MSRFRSTRGTALVASIDRDGIAVAPKTNPADLRPCVTGKKSDLFSRYSAPVAEHEEAERLIRTQRAQALMADFGPNALVSDMVGSL